jgi:hypothetical protein
MGSQPWSPPAPPEDRINITLQPMAQIRDRRLLAGSQQFAVRLSPSPRRAFA